MQAIFFAGSDQPRDMLRAGYLARKTMGEGAHAIAVDKFSSRLSDLQLVATHSVVEPRAVVLLEDATGRAVGRFSDFPEVDTLLTVLHLVR